MTKEQISICKEILKKFIYKIRINNISQLIFHYYTDSGMDEFKTYPVGTSEYYKSFNYERTKRQIKKKILSTRNNYWNLDESKLKIIESFCINNSKEFDKLFKEYIENLWTCSLKEQTKEFEKEEREAKEKDDAKLKAILKEKFDLYKEVVTLILNDTSEYPYKSDKIKILLELELDVDTIYLILAIKAKWMSPKGYINKYFEERKEGIKQRKIVVYELNSTIKHIISQLRSKVSK